MIPMLITMTKQNLSIKEGMNMYANRKYKAIRADLSNYLITHHPEAFTLEYGSLRMKGNHSLSIKLGFPGYYDFGTGEGGNSLQFLVNYAGCRSIEMRDICRSLLPKARISLTISRRGTYTP